MVCLGNICRSPVADGLLRKKSKEAGLDITVDSCGTGGWHAGESPDLRSQENALKNGLDISFLRARQFQESDLDNFDLILCMDKSNLSNVQAMAQTPEQSAKIQLMLDQSFPGKGREVPDPYYEGADGFQNVYKLLEDACDELIIKLKDS